MEKKLLNVELSISIVIYKTNIELLIQTLETLIKSCKFAELKKYYIFLINNSKNFQKKEINNLIKNYNLISVESEKNIGYGKGHNLILSKIKDYHLILNPDVGLKQESIKNALNILINNQEFGLLTPSTFNKLKERQYLIRSYPSLFGYFLRSIDNNFIRKKFKNKLNKYLNKDLDYTKRIEDIDLTSGCFMLYRKNILKEIDGFDSQFFLYLEDFDISIRTKKITKIVYDPTVEIIHHGGNTSKKSFNHWIYFISSTIKFFNKYKWKLF